MARKPKPWERQPQETEKAFRAFACYRDLGPGERTLDKVGEALYPPEQSTRRKRAAHGRILNWSRKHRWVNRVAAWDAENERKAEKAKEQALHRSADEWAKKFDQSDAELWDLTEAMLERAREMSRHPTRAVTREVETPEGRKQVTVEAAKWQFTTLASLAETIREVRKGIVERRGHAAEQEELELDFVVEVGDDG